MVDDDPEFCDSLWEVLREQNYRVAVAHDLRDADAKLKRGEYQVVRLPGGSGAEVFRLVRRTHGEAGTILITGFRTKTEQQVADILAEAADAVVYKPFDVGRLPATPARLARPGAA